MRMDLLLLLRVSVRIPASTCKPVLRNQERMRSQRTRPKSQFCITSFPARREKGLAFGPSPNHHAGVKVFFFGVGYCAEAFIRRTPAIEPSGTVRSDERVAALRRKGVEAHMYDGAQADPGVEDALKRAE